MVVGWVMPLSSPLELRSSFRWSETDPSEDLVVVVVVVVAVAVAGGDGDGEDEDVGSMDGWIGCAPGVPCPLRGD